MTESRYEIIKLIGKGRTGGVYEAEDTVLGRKVALRRFFDSDGDSEDSEWESNFVDLAQSLGSIQHPGLATVFDAGVDEDGVYITSQLLQGESLNKRLRRGAINEWDVYQTIEAVLDTMSVAHQSGFIHGAFNPSSVMRVPRVSGGYRNVIIDFGLNELAPLIQGKESARASMVEPTMMAPEMFESGKASELSDIYMIGQFAYLCLVGGHPFAGKSVEDAAKAHAEEELKLLHKYDLDISKEFSDWVHSLILKDPAARPQSAVEALKTLPRLQKPVDYESLMESMGKLEDLTGKVDGVKTQTATQAVARPALLTPAGSTAPHTVTAAAVTQSVGTMPQQTHTGVLAAATATAATLPNNGAQGIQPVEEKKGNGLLIGIIALAGVCVVAAIAAVFVAGGSDTTEKIDDVENEVDLLVSDTGELDYTSGQETGSDTNENVTSAIQMKSSYSVTDGNQLINGISNKVEIPSDALDFIFIDRESTKKKKSGNDAIFDSFEKIGDFTNQTLGLEHYRFFDKSINDTKGFRSYSVGVVGKGKFDVGDGFRVVGKVPSEHEGNLKLDFYFSQGNCFGELSFQYLDLDDQEWSEIYDKDNGPYVVSLELTNPKAGERFSISLINSSSSSLIPDRYRMVFHGIVAKK